ncbi:protein PHLOEM PROTEIN 2-LIKE A9-like [Pistacia vera]|uniref:protein PHLOEM PROTEIN 2-LIKE A9-like n=1 Tax=Pistacia vera TaxID=55513 RepID=UPI0012630DD9|nr:protein PHLOEM PROTEIN 2-LIKE A9-like [Pistacia vera]
MSSSPHYVPPPGDVSVRDGDKITIKPRGFNIVWGNDSRYWKLPGEGKNDEPAELVQVSWLEVTGSVTVTKGKKYKIWFKVSLKDGAFGWNGCPVFMMAKIGKKGRYSWKRIKPLDQFYGNNNKEIPEEGFEMDVPENGDDQLFFGLYEVWSGKWKGGLLIHEAIIKPA